MKLYEAMFISLYYFIFILYIAYLFLFNFVIGSIYLTEKKEKVLALVQLPKLFAWQTNAELCCEIHH